MFYSLNPNRLFFWNADGNLDSVLAGVSDDELFEDWVEDIQELHSVPAWVIRQLRRVRGQMLKSDLAA